MNTLVLQGLIPLCWSASVAGLAYVVFTAVRSGAQAYAREYTAGDGLHRV